VQWPVRPTAVLAQDVRDDARVAGQPQDVDGRFPQGVVPCRRWRCGSGSVAAAVELTREVSDPCIGGMGPAHGEIGW
jgi:hypothetical protein